MANCATCGGTVSNPFDLSAVSADTCQCNLGNLVIPQNDANSGCCVVSVNGKTGEVVLNISDIDLQGNQFFSNTLVYAALSGTSPINFNSSTGVISHANSGVSAGTYGNSSNFPVITVNASGHITSIGVQSVGAFTLGADLTAIEALTGTGFPARTATDTWALRAFSGTSGRIAVTNPQGIAGNPTWDLVTTGVTAGIYGGPASYPIITVDAYGRVTAITSNAFPAVVIPAHTHSLGDLSNVHSDTDTLLGTDDGKILLWESPSWKPSANKYIYELEEFTPTTNFYICTGNADIDVTDMDAPINKLQRWKDHYEKAVIHVDVAMYVAASVLSGDIATSGNTRYISDKFVGTVPSGFEPIHTISMPCSANFVATRYWNSGHTVQFSSYQLLYHMSVTITPDGNVYLNYSYHNTEARFPILSATDQVICHIVGSYPTKTIVPS